MSKLIFAICLIFCSSNYSSSHSNSFIEYLKKEGFRCKEYKSYHEIKYRIDLNKTWGNKVLYVKNDGGLFGFIFFKDTAIPCLFILDDKALTLFMPNPMIDQETNYYNKFLSNFYCAYHVSFETREVSYVSFNFGFPNDLTIETYKKIEPDSSLCYKIRCEKIPYPIFNDTTKIQEQYKKFYSEDLNKCWNKTEGLQHYGPVSELARILSDFLKKGE